MSNIEQRIIENEIEKSLGNDFSIEKAFDILDIVKGKRAQLGEIREWRGGRFRRTANGWEKIKEGARGEKKNGDMNVEDVKKKKSSLKEELDHHNEELDNLENKKEDYIKRHGEEKYNERHKKIEDKIEDTRKELDNLKSSDKIKDN